MSKVLASIIFPCYMITNLNAIEADDLSLYKEPTEQIYIGKSGSPFSFFLGSSTFKAELDRDDDRYTVGGSSVLFEQVELTQSRIFLVSQYQINERFAVMAKAGVANFKTSTDDTIFLADAKDSHKLYGGIGGSALLYGGNPWSITGFTEVTFFPTYDDTTDISNTSATALFANDVGQKNFGTGFKPSPTYEIEEEATFTELIIGCKFNYKVTDRLDLFVTPHLFFNNLEYDAEINGTVTDTETTSSTFNTTVTDHREVSNDFFEEDNFGLILGGRYLLSDMLDIGVELQLRSEVSWVIYLTIGL